MNTPALQLSKVKFRDYMTCPRSYWWWQEAELEARPPTPHCPKGPDELDFSKFWLPHM